jgi:hypothetical protein
VIDRRQHSWPANDLSGARRHELGNGVTAHYGSSSGGPAPAFATSSKWSETSAVSGADNPFESAAVFLRRGARVFVATGRFQLGLNLP